MKVRGGMTGSGTVYGLNITALHISLADSLAVSHNIPLEAAIELLRGLFDGDDTVLAFETPVVLDRWFQCCKARWGLLPKLEWCKESLDPDHDWTGLPIRGWRVTSEAEVRGDLVKAGILPGCRTAHFTQ